MYAITAHLDNAHNIYPWLHYADIIFFINVALAPNLRDAADFFL